jgi:hypothetical protein
MQEMKDLSIDIIYVRLLGEGTDIWVPVKAVEIGDSLFKILADDNYSYDNEDIEFKPGEVVACELQIRSIGDVLVAVRAAQG